MKRKQNFSNFPLLIMSVLLVCTFIMSCAKNEVDINSTHTFTDSRDGNVYKTVKIGNQIWMAENLAYLPKVSLPTIDSNTASHYYVYGYSGTNVAEAKATANYTTYGVLYNWSAAMDGSASSTTNPSGVQGVCPSGWHFPSDAEWSQLESYLAENGYNYDGTSGGGRNKIAKSLANKTGWKSSTDIGTIGNIPKNNNSSGFAALPGGRRDANDGSFRYMGNYGDWWTSTEDASSHPIRRYLGYDGTGAKINGTFYKSHGFSVRCVRD